MEMVGERHIAAFGSAPTTYSRNSPALEAWRQLGFVP